MEDAAGEQDGGVLIVGRLAVEPVVCRLRRNANFFRWIVEVVSGDLDFRPCVAKDVLVDAGTNFGWQQQKSACSHVAELTVGVMP